jgi:LacI family transcriptional regulator, galactose operon repressor
MDKKVKVIKLEDLAKKLKVSKVTISKALRNHPDISSATTKRVKDLADKLGYVPNYMAKNLSARKSNTIGLVIPKIAHLFFASVIESIYDTAFENNYETLLTVSQEQEEREKKHILSLLSMRVDGLIVSITQETQDTTIFKRVLHQNIPLVFVDRVPELDGVSSVTVDDKGGSYSAVTYAIGKGYRKMAHIGGYPHVNIGKARREGFVEALKANNLPINENWIIGGGFGEADGYNGFMKIYDKKNLPEYILSVTYPVALGIYNAATELGIRIPEDIEVTCFGKNSFNESIPSVFNFVDQPTRELGKCATDLIIRHINDPKGFEPEHIELKTQLIINNGKSRIELAG